MNGVARYPVGTTTSSAVLGGIGLNPSRGPAPCPRAPPLAPPLAAYAAGASATKRVVMNPAAATIPPVNIDRRDNLVSRISEKCVAVDRFTAMVVGLVQGSGLLGTIWRNQ